MRKKPPGFTPLRYIKYGLLVLAAFATVIFVLENQEVANVHFLGWLMPSLPVSVYMLISLLFGLAVGPLFAWYVHLRGSRANKLDRPQ